MSAYIRYILVATLSAAAVVASIIPPSYTQIAPRQVAGTPTIAVQQLIAGIGFNIMAQQGEVAVASIMQSMGAAPTPDMILFKAAKATTPSNTHSVS
jgi:hypothetical protein